MQLIEVKNKQTAKDFIQVPVNLYKGHPTWIRPLDKDINDVFDEKQNKLFRGGEAIRWILKNEKGELIGRIAAFINPQTKNKTKQVTGGIGFFECINNKNAAFLLFDTAKSWLQEKGVEAMEGPINFGERDKWWGCLVDGYDIEPNYCCNYNYNYYKDHFEAYGFKEYFQQYTYGIPVQSELPENYLVKAERIKANPSYSFKHIEPSKIEKFAEDFVTIYNKAWARNKNVAALKKAHAVALFKKMKPVMDKNIVWYAYYDNEPIGFFVVLPELNQIFKHLNGKLDTIGKLKFLFHKWRGTCRKMFGLVFGIVPEHQGKGLEGAIIKASADHIQPLNRYDYLEMNWIGDFNPSMMRVCEVLGADIIKTHITYRYLFDRSIPFERAPILK